MSRSSATSSEGSGRKPRPRSRPHPTVVIDTREQLPYWFTDSVLGTLKTGDYSAAGYEHLVTIERKSKSDAYASVGQHRDRFKREWERMVEFDYAALVVEATMPGMLDPPEHSLMHPNAVIGTYLSWSVRYGVPVFFVNDRAHGQSTVAYLLRAFVFYYEEGKLCR